MVKPFFLHLQDYSSFLSLPDKIPMSSIHVPPICWFLSKDDAIVVAGMDTYICTELWLHAPLQPFCQEEYILSVYVVPMMWGEYMASYVHLAESYQIYFGTRLDEHGRYGV